MLSTRLLSHFLRVSSGRALTMSGLVHAGALVLLAQSWIATTVAVPRLAGSRQAVIQLDASFRETRSPIPVMVPAMTVEVTPSVVHAFNRTFMDTPSAEIDLSSDVIVRAAATAFNDTAGPAVTRAYEADELLAVDASPPIELPRFQSAPRLPRTPTAVPPLLEKTAIGSNQTSSPEIEYAPPPRYSELARQRGWQGTVTLVVKIDATGRVTSVEVDESSGYQVLDAAAVNAVRRWRYQPAVGPHGPVATEELQPVTFRLPR